MLGSSLRSDQVRSDHSLAVSRRQRVRCAQSECGGNAEEHEPPTHVFSAEQLRKDIAAPGFAFLTSGCRKLCRDSIDGETARTLAAVKDDV